MMETIFKVLGGVVIAGVLVVAAPQMAHQVTSDDGGWYSGATPDCPSWPAEAECENSLPPTMERTSYELRRTR